ncbi:pirin family protein [Silvanigrella paludirubra]|uniref:Pirin family protein n=1 Tax=Silvanigrella paludirubra TaxID=2499159 RepID=A0A6N6VZP4_9BACT|nr:pirin family protein [Silvanigrella paludirubra]KAB8040806.1 pirin family protein [Silvanigrella paludirubra]
MNNLSNKRKIIFRTKGSSHGAITRLISPDDIGEMLKPFVFLDYVNAKNGPGFAFHPHSGIATLTHPLTFDVQHESSNGQIDTVQQEGIEWVIAGGGLWHRAKVLRGQPVQGFQLWISLPPNLENTESSALFISPSDVPKLGPVTVLLGEYENAKSLIKAPLDINCFIVKLKKGEVWNYVPPEMHNIAWTFAQMGQIKVNEQIFSSELVIFEEGNHKLNFTAVDNCTFLFGSSKKHDYPLVLGTHSVHTNEKALNEGKNKIEEIKKYLLETGKLK